MKSEAQTLVAASRQSAAIPEFRQMPCGALPRRRYASRVFRFLLSAFCFLFSLSCFSATDAALAEAQQRGREFAAKLLADRPADVLAGPRTGDTFSQSGIMEIRPKGGPRVSVPFTVRVTSTPTNWITRYETTNSPVGSVRLDIVQNTNAPNQYWLTQTTNAPLASAKPRQISGDDLMAPFAGSDFWIADLGLEFLHWSDQRLAREEKRRSRDCQVLESRPPVAKSGFYGRVVTYMDIESGGIIVVEAFGVNERLMKSFVPKAPKKVNDNWELQKMSIRNEMTGSQTSLDFSPPEKP